MASLDYEGQLLPLQPSREAQTEPLFSLSSALGNDSCGVEADAKYNDTDLCWGPLRRVDAYRIYLVSGLASAPQPRPARPPWGPGAGSRLRSWPNFAQRAGSARPTLWPMGPAQDVDGVTATPAPSCPGHVASAIGGLDKAFGQCQLQGCDR